MLKRTLGSTGLQVSVVGIGTWQFGGEWGMTFAPADVAPMFKRGKELGINLIDTAECYGDHLSEQLIGEAIDGDRDSWILATKFGHKFHGNFDRTEPRSPADILEQLEESLTALRTDRVELYQYHSFGDDKFFDQDVLAVLHKAKQQGKILHLGNSVGWNGNVEQVRASKQMGIEFIQIIYNRLDQTPENTCFPVCHEQHLGVLVRVPLASGFLSGKYKPGATFIESDVRSRAKAEDRDAKLKEVQKIAAEELPAGVPMAQWALAWCLKNSAVTSVIPWLQERRASRIECGRCRAAQDRLRLSGPSREA